MLQTRNPWEMDEAELLAAAQAPAGPVVVGTPRPRQPPAQTPTQSAIDEVRLDRLRNPPPSLPQGYRLRPDGTAEAIPGLPPQALAPRGRGAPLTEQQRNSIRTRYHALDGFERVIGRLETLYDQNLRGPQGGVLGVGGDRNWRANLPLAPTEFDTFQQVGGQLIDQIIATYDISGGEANSMAELRARFGPYIPAPTDPDSTIEEKLSSLRSILTQRRAELAEEMQSAGFAVPAPVPPPPAPPPAMEPPASPDGPDGPRVSTGGQAPQVDLSRDGDQAIDDSQVRISNEINRRANSLLLGGASDARVREFGRANGLDPARLEEVLRYRRSPEFQRWRRQNPGQGFRLIDPNTNREMGAVEGAVAEISASPLGSFVINAGNAVIPLPLIASATGGNPDEVRAGIAVSRNENPLSSFAGTVAGTAGVYSGGARVAGAASQALGPGSRVGQFLAPSAELTALTPRAVAGDALYGTVQGLGENGDPVSGAILSGVGGAVGRAVTRGTASAISPTGGGAADLLADVGPVTLGQRVRGNPLGAAYNLIEESAQGIPLLGSMVTAARQAPRDRWRDARWQQTMRFLDDPATGGRMRMPEGLNPTEQQQFARQAFDDAYDRIRQNLTFRPDGAWSRDLGQIQRRAARLSGEDEGRFTRLFEDAIGRRLRNGNGQLTGQDFTSAASEVGSALRSLDPRNLELREVLTDLDNALHNGARRHSPRPVVQQLNRADAGYAHLVTLQNAARRRLGNADADPADFGPSDVLQATRNSGLRGNRFLRGQTPFYREARRARRLEDVLPSSGTSERTAAMSFGNAQLAQLGVLGGGATAASTLGADPYQIGGVTALPILASAPGVRSAFAGMMRPRSGRALTVADYIRGRPTQAAGPLGALSFYGASEDPYELGY